MLKLTKWSRFRFGDGLAPVRCVAVIYPRVGQGLTVRDELVRKGLKVAREAGTGMVVPINAAPDGDGLTQ